MSMPIPNHCIECDKPLPDGDSWMCESCQEKEDTFNYGKHK